MTEQWDSPEQAISGFSDQIEKCLDGSDWESLSSVLLERQSYIEKLFGEASTAENQNKLKALAERILREDEIFVMRIEWQKQSLTDQQQAFQNSQKALNAYQKNY